MTTCSINSEQRENEGKTIVFPENQNNSRPLMKTYFRSMIVLSVFTISLDSAGGGNNGEMGLSSFLDDVGGVPVEGLSGGDTFS